MPTRLSGLLALLMLLLVPASGALAAAPEPPASTDDGPLVLAVEGGGEPQVPEPRGPEDEENEYAPDDYERAWVWWLSVILAIGILPLLLLIGGGYYFLVWRPAQREREGGRERAGRS